VKILHKLLIEKRLFTLSAVLIILSLGVLVQFAWAKSWHQHWPHNSNYIVSSDTGNKPAVASSSAQENPDQTLGTTTTVSNPTPTPKPAPKPVVVPPQNKVAFGVASDSYNNQNNSLASIQQNLGIKLSSVSMYKEFGGTFNPGEFSYAKAIGAKVLLAWEPWDPSALGQITSGAQDSYIRSFADSIKQYGGGVTLRFAHEMNGDWYPWGSRPGDYIAAYRHLHDIFAQQGVSNVNWMWCVNVTWDGNNIGQYYPGDDVVDSIGIDGFNYGTTQNYGGWQSFSTIFGPSYQFLTRSYNKPLVIAETASVEFGGDKAGWVSNMLNIELPQKFPRIREVVWFDIIKAENGKTTDWRLDSSPSSLAAFQYYFKN